MGHDSEPPQDSDDQLPSWEELANIEFPFDPKDYAKPFFYGGLGLFTVGLAAGTVVSGVTKPPPPSVTEERTPEAMMAARAEGFRLASKALLYGTCLCGMFAVAGVYTIHKVAQVNSVEEWVEKLRVWVPEKRALMEQQLQPVLNRIRDTGNNTIPTQWQNWQQRFQEASVGKWLARKTKKGWSENQESSQDEFK
ncbi:hypothetical protein GpartN1_g7601.t1 [Galdieria partita]|uniref:Transmembrane protein 242 n=1 Tax=Galdieria partita TaxID=83374 RepID=A0A9C7Q508_9RHOD|nr:hypothetical protein GpartN1_g7601.t1 [Galdieria partita]